MFQVLPSSGITHKYHTRLKRFTNYKTGKTKGGSITVQLTSCLNGLELAVLQLTIFVFICKID
jgi:hypothetical protein